MRVLAISHDSLLYGAQRSLLDIVEGLAAAGHEVHVIAPRVGPLTRKLDERGIPVHVMESLRWVPSSSDRSRYYWIQWLVHLPRSLGRAVRLIQMGRFDVVYTNTVTVLDFALAARMCGIPHVWHLREAASGNLQLRSPFSNATIAGITRALSRKVIFNSYGLQRRYGTPSRKDLVIHNGFKPLDQVMAAPSRLPPTRLNVVTIGYMDQRKGLDILLDAVALLPERLRTRMVLKVVGEIEEDYMTRDIAPRLAHTDGVVELLGWVEQVDEILANADLLVSSARDEPFGRTLVEAMMAGVPVLATRAGGPEEIVIHEVTGLLIPTDDPGQLSAGLARLLDHPDQLKSFGRAGRERAIAEFSFRRCLSSVEQCLVETASMKRTASSPQA